VELTRTIHKLTARAAARVRLTARRAVLTLLSDAPKLQTCQLGILDGEVRDGVERFQDYGFVSRPFSGAEAIVLALGGSSDHSVVVCIADRRYRMHLAEGEVALYDDQGQYVTLARDKKITVGGCDEATVDAAVKITATAPTIEAVASTKVRLDTPLVQMTGNLTVAGYVTAGGNITDGTRSLAADRAIYNGHTHPETGTTTQDPNQSM
jgi:phage baseplate assembly protein V